MAPDPTGSDITADTRAEQIRVRGLVQGVGFRPTLWRLARRFGVRGWVANDGAGVVALLCGAASDIDAVLHALRQAPPPLARIESIERVPAAIPSGCHDFRILPSRTARIEAGIVPDAATCPDCLAEISDPNARRYRYAFANCTACGPRLSIINAIPYDRPATTMRDFRMCAACAAEYADPADRRFHAQPIACATCGPRVWLEPTARANPIDAARMLLLAGEVVAIKALGGFHLACDATNAEAVGRLRHAKRREAKPFALMARDLSVVRRYAEVSGIEAAALQSSAAPIVLLVARFTAPLAPGIAPGLVSVGFMLPSTPLHHLLLAGVDRPLVMTSGNLADEPQCIGNDEARARLRSVAGHVLLHDRDIARRVDDSVVRVMAGAVRVVRRARGYAPAPLRLPPGFETAPPLLAMGGELKNTFALLRGGEAVLSHHIGDLEHAAAYADYRQAIVQYRALFAHDPHAVAVDRHPDYLSTQHGQAIAATEDFPLVEVQHHHAHLAACLVDNAVPLETGPVLGIVLDGLGWGEDGTIWGGEFLYGDYRGFRRLACLKPVAMPGGAQAVREPWRNAYAQIAAAVGWTRFGAAYGGSELHRYLSRKPVAALQSIMERGVNSPLSSSCGRLFDAVAAAVGLCRDRAMFEGQAAMLLEAAADGCEDPDGIGYPFGIAPGPDGNLLHLDVAPLWPALLDDIAAGAPAALMAARFHTGLADALAAMAARLRPAGRIALSGGVFQNRMLLEALVRRLTAQGWDVLSHRQVPANDGGLALGQAAVAAARLLAGGITKD